MSVNSETRQRLLELVYGLLTEQEAAALRLRIEDEPEIGHAYSQVEKIAARIAEAGRLKTSSIVLERPSSRHGSKRTEESRHRSRSPQVSPRTRIAHWIVGVGSVLLLLVSVWGYVYHHGQLSEIAAGQLRLVVTGPSRLQTGAANTYSVVTMDVKGVPVQSHVEIALYSGNDRQLFRQKEETDPQGRVLLTIPSDINLPTGVRLEIGATHEHKEERIAATMSVEPVRYQTRLSSDRPTYRTGETVYYRSLTLSQFGLLGDRDLSVQFEILDPAGAVVRESSVIGQTKRGVGNGAFRIPEGLPAGRYTLVVRSLDKSFAQERLGFCVMPSKAAPTAAPSAASASAVATDRAASKVKVEFYPEGGELVAGLENRVYFAAWDENGRPADIRGTVVTHEGKSVVDVESTHQGMGTFTFFAAPDELYRLQLTSPVTVAEGVLLPRVSVEQKVGLRTGRGVYDSRSPLEFNIRSTEDRLPLVAAAVCRGVLVAQTAVFARKGDNPVTLPLTPEVAGVVRLTVYRYASAQPEPLVERLVYRQPSRQMRIRVGEHPPRYSPGEKVSMSLTATNEIGEPVAATFGVSVVDETALGSAEAPSSPAFFLLGDVERPEDLEKADFYLSDKPQAARALDLLLGTQGWRRFGQPADDSRSSAMPAGGMKGEADPPALFDNLAEICAKYDQSLDTFHQRQTGTRRTITVVSFFGGFGLVILVAMLTLLKIISGIRLWVPALAASVGCLAIGTLLMNPDRNQPALEDNVAFSPFAPADVSSQHVPAVPQDRPLRDGRPCRPVSSPDASPSHKVGSGSVQPRLPAKGDVGDLQQEKFPIRYYAHHRVTEHSDRVDTAFWHPLLVAGTNGRTQFEFELPESLARFRLRADGHGAGRVATVIDSVVACLPYRLTAKMPPMMLVGDTVSLPVEVANETGQTMPVEVALEHVPPVKVEGSAIRSTELATGKTHREWFQIQAAQPKSDIPLQARIKGGGHVDAVKHRLTVVPPGYPVCQAKSGRLDPEQELTVDLPDRWVPNSLEVTLTALPSGLADLQCAIEGLLRTRPACLEQVVTLNFLYSLALKYLPESGMFDLGIARDARSVLSHCEARLAPFGSPEGGLGWLGSPADEALTAYTLFQLRTSAQLCLLPPPLIDRTAEWLNQRRSPKGGFLRAAKPDAAAVPPDVANAYIISMLAQSGAKGINAQLEYLAELGRKHDDPYLVALAAAGLADSSFDQYQESLCEKLAKAQFPDGHVESKLGSITRSAGPSLTVETTALALWAWLDSPSHADHAELAATWLIAHRSCWGTFGSTQATMLAIRALMEHAKTNRSPTHEGKIVVRLASPNPATIGERAIPAGAQEPIVVAGLENGLKPGTNRLQISLSGAGRIPYLLNVAYHTDQRPTQKSGPLQLSTRLSSSSLKVGQSVDFKAELTNVSHDDLPLVVALIRLPAGLEVSPEQAAQLKQSGVVDSIEVCPGEVVCCWRRLPAKKTVSLNLRPMATMFGKTTSRPSRAYVCYQTELECWSEPVAIEIRAE